MIFAHLAYYMLFRILPFINILCGNGDKKLLVFIFSEIQMYFFMAAYQNNRVMKTQ